MSIAAVADGLALECFGGNAFLAEPRRTARGRPFAPTREQELFPDLMDLARRLSSAGPVLAIPEFVAPFGVADLVAVAIRGNALAERIDASVPPLLNELDATLVAGLSARRGRSSELLSRRLSIDPAMVTQRLSTLARTGAVERLTSGSFVRHPAVVPLGRVHALEAKVADWKRAIDQARTYALWADYSTSVLMSLPVSHDSARDAAHRWGTGLALRAQWVCRPSARSHQAGRRLWASEHVVAALIGT